MDDFDIVKKEGGQISKTIRKKWPYLVLLLIILFGFYLRAYHIDYPVVGYHNWKETHYLTESRNFAEDGFFEKGFFVPTGDYISENINYSDVSGGHADTFPTSSIVTAIGFNIFGESLVLARLVSILFVLGSIIFMYLFVKELFKREDIALVSAALMSFNPLLVFFGRQVQLINPALFFMMGSLYFYLIWRKNETMKYMVLFALFGLISVITKYSFFLFAIPILLTFPYKKLKQKKIAKQSLIGALFVVPFFLWGAYMNIVGERFNTLPADVHINLGTIFTSSFWVVLKAFAADNYTLLGTVFALIGAIFVFYFGRKKFANKFLFAWIFGLVIWFLVMSFKLQGHNYHQYPVVPLILILIAYAFVVISHNIAKFLRFKYAKTVFMIALLVILYIPSVNSMDRMFDTQFIGLDIAGEYINENSEQHERLFYPSHQSHGIMWHADRMGFSRYPDVETIKIGEEKNATWLFAYQWGLDVLNDEERWSYFSSNYSLKQAAFIRNNEGRLTPIYLLLNRGGSFDINELASMIEGKDPMTREYEFSNGKQVVYYFNF